MVFILNTLEWSLTNEINHGKLTSRLSNLETKVFGETKSGSLIDRLKKLANISLPQGEIPAKEVSIPADTLVKIQVLEKVSSKESSEGQKVPFKVVNDVSIDNKLVVPAGSKGTMEITKIEKSGKLGQNAEIELDFYDVDTIDGHEISLKLDKKSREINRSEKLAIGASLLATALLGPVGLIAGYFVEGEEKTIEAGTEFYCQTLSRTSIYGLELEK